LDVDALDSRGTVAANHAGGVRRADPRLGVTVRLLYPGASVDAAHSVEEPDGFWQLGRAVGVDRSPLVA